MSNRFDYVEYDAGGISEQALAKSQVQTLEKIIIMQGDGLAQSIALTKLEECYMWIGMAIRDNQIKRNANTKLK